MFQKGTRSVRCGLCLCLILLPFLGYAAEPYRVELHGGFSRVDTNEFFDADFLRTAGDAVSKRLDFVGEYFFRPVDTSSGPLREAAFLDRAPSLRLSVAVTREDSESRTTRSLGPGSRWSADSRTTDYQLAYRFAAAGRPWIGVARYGYADRANEGFATESWRGKERHNSYSVGLGRYVTSRTAVIAEYGRLHRDTYPPIDGPADDLLRPITSFRYEILTVGVHSLLELGTRHRLGLTAAWHKTSATSPAHLVDGNKGSYEVGVTYYPRNDISVALSATGDYGARDGWPERRGYMLDANWFATKSVAVGLRYESTDSRLRNVGVFDVLRAGSTSDGLRLGVSWRY